jgi:hypothetical protein
MAFNGSGTYTLPGAALTAGATVSSTENNTFRNDVATAFNKTLTRDGQAVPTANLPMGGFKHTGLAAGTTAGDSVRYEQLPSASNLVPVASGGTGATDAATALVNLSALSTATNVGFKNRIINGAMVIDQRNAGASVTQTTSSLYVTDRFLIRGSVSSKFTGQQSSTAPAGFVNSLLCTSSSAYSVGSAEAFFLAQMIEGNNVADFGWGSANAVTVTLSFWVRSSLTGTFGGAVSNYAGDRSYPFTYTISAANTWEQKSVTIAGDTSGTWVTNTGGSVAVQFGLGAGSTLSGTAGAWSGALYRSATGATSVVGTNGATFYITGVQLEKGSTATSFDYRPYGTELALCQRYYYKTYNIGTAPGTSTQQGAMSLEVLADGTLTRLKLFSGRLPVSMRTQPTVTPYSQTGTADRISQYNDSAITLTVSSIDGRGENSFGYYVTTTTSGSASNSYIAQFVASAEL